MGVSQATAKKWCDGKHSPSTKGKERKGFYMENIVEFKPYDCKISGIL